MADEDITLDGKPLSSLRVADLKAALEQRNLPKSGQKNTLIKRLKGALMLENLQRSSSSHSVLQPNSQIGEEMCQNSFIKQYLAKQQELLRQRLEREAQREDENDESPAGAEEDEDHSEDNDSSSNVADKHQPLSSQPSSGSGSTFHHHESPEAPGVRMQQASFQHGHKEPAASSPPRAVAYLSVRVLGQPDCPPAAPRSQEKEHAALSEPGSAHPVLNLSRSARSSAGNHVQDDSDDDDDDDSDDSDDDEDWGPGSGRAGGQKRVPPPMPQMAPSVSSAAARSKRKLQPPQHIPPPPQVDPIPMQLRHPTPPPSPPHNLFPLPDTPKQSPPDDQERDGLRDPQVVSFQSSSRQRQDSDSSSGSSSPEPPVRRRPGPLSLLVHKMETEEASSAPSMSGETANSPAGCSREPLLQGSDLKRSQKSREIEDNRHMKEEKEREHQQELERERRNVQEQEREKKRFEEEKKKTQLEEEKKRRQEEEQEKARKRQEEEEKEKKRLEEEKKKTQLEEERKLRQEKERKRQEEEEKEKKRKEEEKKKAQLEEERKQRQEQERERKRLEEEKKEKKRKEEEKRREEERLEKEKKQKKAEQDRMVVDETRDSGSSSDSDSKSDSSRSSHSSSSSSSSFSRDKIQTVSQLKKAGQRQEAEGEKKTDVGKVSEKPNLSKREVSEPSTAAVTEVEPDSESSMAQQPAAGSEPESSESRPEESTTPKAFAARRISLTSSKASPASTDGAAGDPETGNAGGRKRRWGSSTAVTVKKPSISITTDSLKSLIPDIKVNQEAVVDLHPEELQLSGDEENLDPGRSDPDKGLKIRRTVTQVVPNDNQENGQANEDEDVEKMETENQQKTPRDKLKCSLSDEASEPQISVELDGDVKKVTPSDNLVRRSISQQKSGVSVTIDDPVRTTRQPSPPRGKVSNIIHVTNLVRPFTLLQLKELLNRTGSVVEDGFWIDKIKSHCYVTYSTEEEAISTRTALHGVKWPASNPKVLSVDFCEQDELDFHKGILKPKKEEDHEVQPIIPPNRLPPLMPERDREKDHDRDRDKERERDRGDREREWDRGVRDLWAERRREMERRERARGEREWDRDKVREFARPGEDGRRSRSRDREKRRRERAKSKEKKADKKDKGDEPPAKLLDDLFLKTKAAPCIYWLPLTEEQATQRLSERLERQKERERRREEEDKKREEEKKERLKVREKDNNTAASGAATGRAVDGDRERDRGRDREGDKRKDTSHRSKRPSPGAGPGRRSRSRSNPRDRRR